jgi:hypothetical protein
MVEVVVGPVVDSDALRGQAVPVVEIEGKQRSLVLIGILRA